MEDPQAHFAKIEAILQQHAEALLADVRALQQADETAQWSVAWKRIYNYNFACCFARQRVFCNWASDAAGWDLLPERVYPNQGNRAGMLVDRADE
ncbi:MAG: hypothetical protein SAJ37_10950 [Oscillatoria sp. PMC 1068.18]|nr:hypothetical protein [Oscillatoria sp. PMC 1076.18]MEC4989258.1 hypothetical protein [Oscillatoria sp. PMC 1068.18]